jgi:hypothetical protein
MLPAVKSRDYSLSGIVPVVRMVQEDMRYLFHTLQPGTSSRMLHTIFSCFIAQILMKNQEEAIAVY